VDSMFRLSFLAAGDDYVELERPHDIPERVTPTCTKNHLSTASKRARRIGN
jgi:hypothetical protein